MKASSQLVDSKLTYEQRVEQAVAKAFAQLTPEVLAFAKQFKGGTYVRESCLVQEQCNESSACGMAMA